MKERNLLLKIEYDGTYFSGWQRQPNCRTVQGSLESALSQVCGQDVKIAGTSRTDAGVHALGQCASFSGEFGIPTERISLAVNNALAKNYLHPGDIRVLEVKEMEPDFHARFSCLGKCYIYRIYNDKDMSVFYRNYCYQVKAPLNLDKIREGASHFVGTHDFKGFMATGGTPQDSTVRTIYSVDVEKNEKIISFFVKGDGFLYNMVRIISGTLVDVGLGKIPAEEIQRIIRSGNRGEAGHTAPPQGLFLSEIYYDTAQIMKEKKE